MTMHFSDTFLQYYFFITFFVFIRKPFMRLVFKVLGKMPKVKLNPFKPSVSPFKKEEQLQALIVLNKSMKSQIDDLHNRVEFFKNKYKEALQNQK